MAKPANGWICDSCKSFTARCPWDCPGCGKEVCDVCFSTYAHCDDCAEGKDDKTLLLAANEAGWEFEEN